MFVPRSQLSDLMTRLPARTIKAVLPGPDDRVWVDLDAYRTEVENRAVADRAALRARAFRTGIEARTTVLAGTGVNARPADRESIVDHARPATDRIRGSREHGAVLDVVW